MTATLELAVIVGDQLLCEHSETEGLHLGFGFGLPKTVANARPVDEAVLSSPAESALRHLCALCKTPSVRSRIRAAAEVRGPYRVGVRGDVLQGERSVVYVQNIPVFELDTEVGPTLAWRSFSDLQSRFSTMQVLVSPSLARVLARALPCKYEAGDRLLAPHLSMLPLRTPTLPPATHTNVFCVGEKRKVLVEPASPFADEVDHTCSWVEHLRSCGSEFQAILVTHHHPDHVGGAVALKKRLGLPCWGHRLTAERLRGQVEFERILEDDETIDLDDTALRAVHTPGHAPGHLCFLDLKTNAMIAGDMVAGVGTILVEPVDGDMALYLDSLKKMAEIAPRALLPAHGGVICDAQTQLSHYREHRLMRERKVIDALRSYEGEATASDLVPQAYEDAPQALWPLAALSLEAHLLKLVADGEASVVSQGVFRA